MEGYSLIQTPEQPCNILLAWKSILYYFEDSTHRQRLTQDTGNIIRDILYSGPQNHFTFGIATMSDIPMRI